MFPTQNLAWVVIRVFPIILLIHGASAFYWYFGFLVEELMWTFWLELPGIILGTVIYKIDEAADLEYLEAFL